jgi:hypothetical protein
MLAKHLNTPEKLRTEVKSIIAASENMHDDIGDDAVQDIVSSLSPRHENRENVEPGEVADTTEAELVAPPKIAKKKGKAYKTKETLCNDATDDNRNMGVDSPRGGIGSLQPPSAETAEHENKKVSGSCRWNIDPENLLPEAKAEAFQRPSDLFAFHALSIAKSLLETTANRKAIRHKIQAMLDEMPDAEYRKWIESFHKLHSGDVSMLTRGDPEAVSKHRRTAPTSARLICERERRGNAGVLVMLYKMPYLQRLTYPPQEKQRMSRRNLTVARAMSKETFSPMHRIVHITLSLPPKWSDPCLPRLVIQDRCRTAQLCTIHHLWKRDKPD